IETMGGVATKMINRNTTIPVSRVEQVCTVHPNQTRIAVRVFQGESRRVEHNLLLGEFSVEGIPHGSPGQAVEIRFTYDLNGVLEVEATVVETKRKVTHLITRHARGMSDAQIAEAVRQMQALKTHPREETENRFLLRRAERLYVELPLAERQWLDVLLSGFEESLELRDPPAMQSHRIALTDFLNRYDSEPGADEPHEQTW
ncbi:MAG: Hsp70 family protein, partial [Planctomycetes bacterium]|nr:Hsp70 family protein [Planctomycetota bacterium]